MDHGFLEIKALGRSCFLGQLYDATTNSLLPGFSLFKEGDIKPREVKVNKTELKFKEVKSLSDRTVSLGLSAELSVSIMSGAFGLRGVGSYLDSKQDTSESITVAAIAQYRIASKSLDLNALRVQKDIDSTLLAKTRATHVVTSIVYGGDVVGTLTQKLANKADNTDVKGTFSVDIFKSISSSFSAGAKAELTYEDKEKLNSFNLDVSLSADFSLKEEDATPIDPVTLIEVVRKSSKLVGDGVPWEILLTPLSMLDEGTPNYRELAMADLVDIMNVYDRILKLENSYVWLHDAVEARSELFPTFVAAIRDRALKVKRLVQNARENLRKYLHRYRSDTSDVEDPADFVKDVVKKFATAQGEYEKDKDEWRRYQDRLAAADQHGFPVIGVSAVGSKMNRVNKGMLAAIIVPENANWKVLMDLYGDIAVDIRQWRESIDKGNSEGSQTEFISIYADPLRDTTLYSLDDNAGTLKSALASARATKRGVFLTYGRAQGHIGGLEWNALNKEGWGVIINREEAWRYIGDVHLSKPHGRGAVSYADQTKYAGDFVNGRCDGFGERVDKNGNVVSNMRGIFIQNQFVPQGVLVEVVVNKDGIPIQFGKVAMNKFDSVRVQVDRIATVMGWEDKQRFRIIPEGGTKVDVIGSTIDPKESARVEISSWDLDGARVPKITVHIL